MVRAGVVGHVEWVDFAVVSRLPRPGEIVEAREGLADACGGGGVAAVQMARLAGAALLLTALGADTWGEQAAARLRAWGVEVHAAVRDRPQRRCFTHLTDDHERTITVVGERLVPHADDPLPWDAVGELDAVYVTGGDAAAVRAARAARVVVATPRAAPGLVEARVPVDALVLSAGDAGEQGVAELLDPPPALVVRTRGAQGGAWAAHEGRTGAWEAVAPPRPPVDSFGCGDTFAGALTLALGAGLELDAALRYAARAGAAVMGGRGPYGASLDAIGPPR